MGRYIQLHFIHESLGLQKVINYEIYDEELLAIVDYFDYWHCDYELIGDKHIGQNR